MWGHHWGFMDGWNGFGWYGPAHMVAWLVALILIVALIAWFFRSSSRTVATGRHSPGLDMLEARYARGEINRDEYLQKKRDIAG